MRIWLELLLCLAATLAGFAALNAIGASILATASLIVVLLAVSVLVSQARFLNSLAMVALGLLLGSVGGDLETGEQRLSFGIEAFHDGLLTIFPFAVLAITVPLLGAERNLTPNFVKPFVQKLPVALRRMAMPAVSLPLIVDGIGTGEEASIIAAMVFLGFLAYCLARNGFPLTTLVVALMLSRLLEEKLRQASLVHRGSTSAVLFDPSAVLLLLIAAFLLLAPTLLRLVRDRA